MSNKLNKRVLDESNYIIETNQTIRKTAQVFKVSKSTIHKDIQERLKKIDINKYKIIEKIFEKHIETRHIIGGQSTKLKYQKLKLNNEG